MTDHLYVGFKLPDAVKEHLFTHAVRLLPRAAGVALKQARGAGEQARGVSPESNGPLRWAHADDWHITLAFLGDVEHRQDDPADPPIDVHGILGRLCRHYRPLRLWLRGAGRFGENVLWMDFGGEVSGLVVRGQSLRLALDADMTYPFRPHMTLATARERGADLDPLVAALSNYEGPMWIADRIHLLRNRPGAAVDESVASWALEGKPR